MGRFAFLAVASGSLSSATAGASLELVGGVVIGRSWLGEVASGSRGLVGSSGGAVMDARELATDVPTGFTVCQWRQKW